MTAFPVATDHLLAGWGHDGGARARVRGVAGVRGRCVVVVVAVLCGLLAAAHTAQAYGTQDRISAGTADAASRGTSVGVAFIDRATGEYRDNGVAAHTGRGSASLVKLFIADDLLYRNSLGQVALSDADRAQFNVMLRSSDDAAANRFWSAGGGPAIVNRVAARYGLGEIAPPVNPGFWGLTTITASNIALYYNGMLAGSGGLPDWGRTAMLAQLRAATTTGTDGYYQYFGIPTGLPGESVRAIKQGWMTVNGQRYNHTSGIVGADNRFIVVVLGQESAGNGGTTHTSESVSRVVQRMYPEGVVPRVQGAIADAWYGLGGAGGRLGLPVTDELPTVDRSGVFTYFQRGAIYWSPGSGAHALVNATLDRFAALGYEQGTLRYPVSEESGTSGGDGTQEYFQHGAIYWSPATGAHAVVNGILQSWADQGFERGPLGYPVTDEVGTSRRDGTFTYFQHGAIYWSPSTGAHAVTGLLLQAWADQGFETGPLGYPRTDPYAVTGGIRVDFQGGSLVLDTASGTVSPAGDRTDRVAPGVAASVGEPTPAPTTSAPPAP